jgi:hypothetical protein
MAGTKTGKVHVWDFKNKGCAASLKVSNESKHTVFSAVVRFWTSTSKIAF